MSLKRSYHKPNALAGPQTDGRMARLMRGTTQQQMILPGDGAGADSGDDDYVNNKNRSQQLRRVFIQETTTKTWGNQSASPRARIGGGALGGKWKWVPRFGGKWGKSPPGWRRFSTSSRSGEPHTQSRGTVAGRRRWVRRTTMTPTQLCDVSRSPECRRLWSRRIQQVRASARVAAGWPIVLAGGSFPLVLRIIRIHWRFHSWARRMPPCRPFRHLLHFELGRNKRILLCAHMALMTQGKSSRIGGYIGNILNFVFHYFHY